VAHGEEDVGSPPSRLRRFGGTDFALRKERSQERPAQRAGLDEARGVSRERSLAGCLGRVSQLPHPGGVTITRVTIYGVRLSMPPPTLKTFVSTNVMADLSPRLGEPSHQTT